MKIRLISNSDEGKMKKSRNKIEMKKVGKSLRMDEIMFGDVETFLVTFVLSLNSERLTKSSESTKPIIRRIFREISFLSHQIK